MRHFWLSIVCFLIYFPAFGEDQALPPLPTMPGMTVDKAVSVPPAEIKPESAVPNNAPKPAEPQVVSPAPSNAPESPSGDNFIDLGGYKLPKVNQPNNGSVVPSPAAPEPVEEPQAVVPAPVVAPSSDPLPATPPSPVVAPVLTPTPVEPKAIVPAPVIAPAPVEIKPESALPNNALKTVEPQAVVPAPAAPALVVPSPEPQAVSPAPAPIVSPDPQAVAPVQKAPEKEPLPSTKSKAGKAKSSAKNKKKEVKHHKENKLVALTPEHSKFIQDELVMFLIPDDDVVLGKVTEEAKLQEMNGKDYINLFWQKYYAAISAPKDYETEIFITTYNHHYVNYARFPLSKSEAKEVAFDSVVRGNLDNLRTMLDNYQILQTYDQYGNSLLIEAVEMNDSAIARLLLLRGIDLYKVNNKGDSALSIAEEYGPESMHNLMKDAVFLGKVR